jgi:CRP/FNR family cyclic AMP-dependent transcriptional regulator
MVVTLSIEVLRRIPLFAELPESALVSLAINSHEVSFKKGEWLFREGDQAEALYIVLSGSVDIRLAIDATRQEFADVDTLVAGDIIGWSALVEPFIYRMGAVALSDTRLAYIDGEALAQVIDTYPETSCKLMRQVTRIIGDRLDALRVRFVSMITA